MNERYGNIPDKVLKTQLECEYWEEDAVVLNPTLQEQLDEVLNKYNETVEFAEWDYGGPKLVYFTAYTQSYIVLLEEGGFNDQFLRVIPRNPTA